MKTRAPASTDFRISVEGVGDFIFGRRTRRDEIKAQVEYARYIDGVEPTAWLQVVCGALADLQVLTVQAPDGWDHDDLLPHDPEAYTRLVKVHQALLEKERSFRPNAGATKQGAGEAAGGNSGIPVPPAVQPDGERPAVP